jgi:hypothetical protein
MSFIQKTGLVLLLLLACPGGARAGDISAFLATAAPSATWGRGYGGTFSTSWFGVVNLEGEAAQQAGEEADSGMASFTASALIAPPVGFLVPYGGVGVGLFRQTLGKRSDFGTLKALVLGVKVKIGPVLVLKGEYRSYDLSGEPLLALDHRFSAGAGITF